MEKWIKREPLEEVKDKFDVVSVFDNFDGLVFSLENSDGTKTVEMIFNGFVVSYRSIDEGARYKVIVDLDERYGVEFYNKSTFFQVHNSLYIEWIISESYGLYHKDGLLHFVILSINYIVDIITF